ncbi:MAG: GspH/FimT family pseudopilin [Proteobacteria bacterium]|nr:GspH/FimT family pseudopilin [Pseudomonadota bacterium]
MSTSRSPLRHTAATPARGITLIELLMVLGIIGVLFGLAIPAVSDAVAATHAMQARAALMASYLSALNGAALANARTTMCPSFDGQNCTSGTDWSHGWIAFVDANGDRERQPGEAILSRQEALPSKVHLHSTRGRTRIEIQPAGSVAGSNVTFTLCDGRGATRAQSLVLSNKSTLRVDTPTAQAIAETCVP